jgi:RNA recognition motif-containing protein
MNIYVGNLSLETTEDDLRQVFEAFGQVISVKIVRSRPTGESVGFGFVGMPNSEEGQTAISELNGRDLKGHTIKVEEGRMQTNYSTGNRGRQGGPDDSHGGGDRRGGFGGDRGGHRY